MDKKCVDSFITQSHYILVQCCGCGACLTDCGKLFEVQAGAGLTQQI